MYDGMQNRSEPESESMSPRAILRVSLGGIPPPKITLIQMGSMCSGHITWCCCCPRERDCRAASMEGRASLRGCSGKWGGYVKISHHGSTGQINYANISCSPRENWLRHFPSCLHRHKCSFPSRLFFSLPPFICRNISDSSDLCPNNQILLIYF